MKFIRTSAYKLSVFVQKETENNHKYRRQLYYRFHVIINAIVSTAIILIAALVLGIFKEALLVFIAYSFLKKYAGGNHLSTEVKCIITSLILFLLPIYIIHSNYSFFKKHNFYILLLTTIISISIFIKYSPVVHKNKKCNPEDYIRLKKRSLIVLFILLALSWSYELGFNITFFSIYFNLTILTETFDISPIGVKLIDKIDTIDIKRHKKRLAI